MRRILLSFVLFVIAAPAATAGPTVGHINVGGITRNYIIDVPAVSGPKPAILMLHGLGDTAVSAMHLTRLPLTGEQQGFVSVFPAGLAKQWNVFQSGQAPQAYVQRWQNAGSSSPPDDVGFITALVKDLVTQQIADPTRVYIAGFSAGGFMAMRMMCEAAQTFAGVALYSASMPSTVGPTCHPAGTVPLGMPLMAIKGTADTHEPYNGGWVLDHSLQVWSAQHLMQFMTTLDVCQGTPATGQMPGGTPQENFERWNNCTFGPVMLVTVTGGGHAVFQLPPPGPTLWAFFQPLHR
jgi:polyhydroxybutyrate depolymerase